jgi:CRISPR-associated protein Cas1
MSPIKDLHELPKVRDSLSYLYVERSILERKRNAVEFVNENGRVMIPVAALCVLMLGPGTSISHAAIKVLADNGCTVLWLGEDATRFYAAGTGETRKAYHLLRQAELASDPEKRQKIVLAMYRKRFDAELDPALTLPQVRGYEGVRVRKAYATASNKYGVEWKGRRYDRGNWDKTDPINRALSAANALLNGLCHAAIVSGGYSPAIGFIHTGKQLSFVYDIADLYKVEATIPVAFATVAESSEHVESRVRQACRDRFRELKLLNRILPDIDKLLDAPVRWPVDLGDVDSDSGLPSELWEQLFTSEGQS